jgi:hypothetical protein
LLDGAKTTVDVITETTTTLGMELGTAEPGTKIVDVPT